MRTKSCIHTLTGHTNTVADLACQGAEPQVIFCTILLIILLICCLYINLILWQLSFVQSEGLEMHGCSIGSATEWLRFCSKKSCGENLTDSSLTLVGSIHHKPKASSVVLLLESR